MRDLCGQDLAALGAAARQNLTTIFRRHTRAEAVTAGANKVGRLESTFHLTTLLKVTAFVRPLVETVGPVEIIEADIMSERR